MSTGHDRPAHGHGHGHGHGTSAGGGGDGGAAGGDSSASLLTAEEYEALVRHEVQCVQRGDMAACSSWQRLLKSVCQGDGGEEDSPARAWACFDLGQLHSFGQKSFFDAALAARYYQRACTQKHYRACYNLAMMYVCVVHTQTVATRMRLHPVTPLVSPFRVSSSAACVASRASLAGTVKVPAVCQGISKKQLIF